MAGHSQFKNIMHRKGAQDAKRAKVFTKIIRELTVAAKTGSPDPDANPRLRSAIVAARGANMPKDTMERAIKRGAGGEDNTVYEEMRYEGYGPGGVAVIVEALTDNRNRTAAEVRAAFNKYGGSLGETNSVSFMFERLGYIRFDKKVADESTIFDVGVEAGADQVESDDESHEIYCGMDVFSEVRDALMARFGDPQAAELIWRANTTTPVSDDVATTLLKLVDVLEDNDDVQKVSGNYEVSESFLSQMA